MKRNVLLILLLSCVRLLAYSQNNTPGFVKDSLDHYITRALHTWNLPGLAIAIVKDGQVVVAKGYGVQSIARKEKVDENTLFMIGSNSKAFTGTLLSWLQFDKKCSLNDKVTTWLPGFHMKDAWVTKHLSLTDILCHRMGMGTFQGDFMYWDSDLTKDQVIEKFGGLTPLYDFRTQWGYTNAGFVIAGACIQKIGGESWESAVKTRLFDPLQMDRTKALSAEMTAQQNIAAPHTALFDTVTLISYPAIDNLSPAASISSSVNDMSHWIICQLDSGKYKGKQVIPFPVISETRKPQSVKGISSGSFNGSTYQLYGLGWFLENYEGRQMISHTGGVDGFFSSVTLLPEERLGVVVLTNNDANELFLALKWQIVDAYLNLQYRNYNQLFYNRFKRETIQALSDYKAKKDTIALHRPPVTDLKNFMGHYVHPVYGYLDINKEGNLLTMTFEHHPMLKGTLECLGGHRFLCTYSNPIFGIKVISFLMENNKVKSLQLSVADFVDPSSYEFIRQTNFIQTKVKTEKKAEL